MPFQTNTSPYGLQSQFQASPVTSQSNQKPQTLNFQNPIQGPGNSQGPGTGGNGFFQALFGRPERNYQQSLLGQEQQPAYQQLLQSIQGRGGGGAFGESADYYRDLLSPDSQTDNAMFAPEQRRFNEQIIPDLAEQFSGHGGIGSSGFRNAAVNAGTDLSERLGAMRAQLRQQGAQGLSNIGAMGLQNFNENVHRPETFGIVGNSIEGASKAFGNATGRSLTGGF